MLVRIALCFTKPALRTRIEALLERSAVHLSTTFDCDDVFRLASESYDVGIIDRLPAAEPGCALLEQIGRLPDRPGILLLSDRGLESGHPNSNDEWTAWLATGTLTVLDATADDHILASTLDLLMQRRRRERLERLGATPRSRALQAELVSTSAAMKRVLETARRVAMADSPVLVLGETGVGKERLAMLLHAAGPRAGGPFVAVNCAAIPSELFESELFGHHRGAFTGAIRARRGKFEVAHGGTIFLDEVGDVPLHLQAKLLRVLQEGHVTPIGGNTPIEIDARVIAATNRDLRAEMQAGRFRRDLYYRLGVVELTMPPLRERPEDIPTLAEAYLRAFREQLGREVAALAPEALEALCRYEWPGNVRELVNVIERAVLLCHREEIVLEDLPDSIAACTTSLPLDASIDALVHVPPGALGLPPELLEHPWKMVREAIVREGERAYLDALLRASRGRIGITAARAGISARSLFEKMRRHGLRKEDYRG